ETARVAPSRARPRPRSTANSRQPGSLPRKSCAGFLSRCCWRSLLPLLLFFGHLRRVRVPGQSPRANRFGDVLADGDRPRRRLPEIGVLARRFRNETDLSGFVEPLEYGMNGGQIVGIDGEVHADLKQSIAHFDGRQRESAAEHQPARIREAEWTGGREAKQAGERTDRLRQMREPPIDFLALGAEGFILPDRGIEGGTVVLCRHSQTYT